jgi:hypothetical protein
MPPRPIRHHRQFVSARRDSPIAPPPAPTSDLHIYCAGVDLLRDLRITGTPIVENVDWRRIMRFTAEFPVGEVSIEAENEVLFLAGTARYYGGLVKTVKPRVEATGLRTLDVECQDYSVLAGMDVIYEDIVPSGAGTDKDVITMVFAHYGTKGIVVGAECQVLVSSFATTTLLGMTLAEFMDAVCKASGGSWYIDYFRHLHYFLTESELAPFGVSDTPDYVTTFPYDAFSYAEDSIGMKNVVYYYPGTGGDAIESVYKDYVSITETAAKFGDNGERAMSIRDDSITSQTMLDTFGAAALVANAKKRTGSFTCWQPGLRGGMSLLVTNADEGLTAQAFAVNSVQTTLMQTGDTLADSAVVFAVQFGDRPPSLRATVSDIGQRGIDIPRILDAGLASAIALDFANGIIRPQIVNALPDLPNAAYPDGSFVVLTTDRKLYRNDQGATPPGWTKAVDGADIIANSIIAGQVGAGGISAHAVTADAIDANAITAEKIDAGAIDFRTLGDSAYDVIASAVPYGSFVGATAGVLTVGTSRDDPTGQTVACPGWTAWRSSGAATLTVVADTAWPGGKYVAYGFAATGSATTNNIAMTTDKFPVTGGSQLAPQLMRAYNTPSGTTLNIRSSLLFYDAAGSYLSVLSQDVAAVGAASAAEGPSVKTPQLVPNNARYARLEVLVWETVAHNAATVWHLGAVAVKMDWSFGHFVSGLTVDGLSTMLGDAYVGGFLTVRARGCMAVVSALAFGNGSYQSVPFSDADLWDPDGMHDPSGNPTVVAIVTARPGIYQISYDMNHTKPFASYVKKNGSTVLFAYALSVAASGTENVANASFTCYLGEGEYFQVFANPAAGTLSVGHLSAVLLGGWS